MGHFESQKILSMAGATAWKDAVVTVRNKDWSLGLLVIDWTFNEESQLIKGKFRKTQNLLDIAGTIELQPSGQLEFKGSVSERIDKSIYSALMLFADGKSANGRLPIKFRKKIQ